MTRLRELVLILVMAFVSFSVGAHSMADVETSLHQKERYAQFVNRSAPPFSLTDADGDTVSLTDLQGKAVVLNFLYTRCTDACPLHMNLIRQLQEGVEQEGLGEDVVFITIATDREDDIAGTRDNMRAYGENFGLKSGNWHFLYRTEGEPAALTPDLAQAYGMRFGDGGEGIQVHGVVTHVIDTEGRMRARFHGLKFQPEHMVTYLKAIARGPDAAAEGFWDRLNEQIATLLKGG